MLLITQSVDNIVVATDADDLRLVSWVPAGPAGNVQTRWEVGWSIADICKIQAPGRWIGHGGCSLLWPRAAA